MIANGTTGDLARRRPFSDSAWIRDHADRRTLRRFALVLQAIGDVDPAPAMTTSFVCSDPMVRNLVTALGMRLEAQAELGTGETQTAVALVRALAIHRLTERFPGGLEISHAVRFSGAAGDGHAIGLWQTQTAPGPLVASFTATLGVKVPRAQALADFTAQQIATIESALALLSSTMPDVAAGMLPHVQLLCRLATPPAATNAILSSSFRDIPGVVFLADPLLVSPLVAAEHILHEACHQRYGELAHAASIVAAGYDDAFCAKIVVPWHRTSAASSVWSTDKALTAAHVYLYLTYFYGMLQDARADRSESVTGELRRRLFSTCERGRFLLRALDAVGRAQLGYAGNVMLDWMIDAFAAFAIEDDGQARLTRLVLERYAEEESEFQFHAGALASRDFSLADERFDAFMAWLDGLEPATSQRFEKGLAGALAPGASAPDEEPLPTELGHPAIAPLERYSRARRERARTIRALLALAPAELARHTERRAMLTFAQAESANLDSFVDPGFRDRLVLERALRRSARTG